MQEVFEKIIEKLEEIKKKCLSRGDLVGCTDFKKAIEIVKQAAEEYNNGWIPVKYHEITDEEREENGFSDDIAYCLDCKMPEDEEEILVTRKWKDGYIIEHDMCIVDIEYSLESGLEWTDVIAWQPLPAPYNPHICTNNDCTFNEGKDCPAAEGCPGYERKRTNFDMCCESMEAMAQIIDVAKIGWTKEQIMEWLQKEECPMPD